ncbi:DNA-binding protein inhibitor ID-2b [Melanotaenia boesemani]|uniref:DNA-binding protein inhibitor ID-2b n=1 Tax=Melanotaenia boesemani TaxID=1250792 RepID=UPI001C05D156|nr:DNA-binding protein inhibitor ID-2b [Melanotaenia boesemani]
MRAGLMVLPTDRQRSSGGLLNIREEPPVLLQPDMRLYYRLLLHLVPGPYRSGSVSRLEVLQRVIDYILDLQSELDASTAAAEQQEPLSTPTPAGCDG